MNLNSWLLFTASSLSPLIPHLNINSRQSARGFVFFAFYVLFALACTTKYAPTHSLGAETGFTK